MSRRKRFTRNLGRRACAPLPIRSTTEWVRFEHAREPYGVFSYVADAEGHLDSGARAELEVIRRWFAAILDAPLLVDDAEDRFWFRAEATELVARARRLAALVRLAGIPIVERRMRRIPGKIRWQDDHQVAVLMYRDAGRVDRRTYSPGGTDGRRRPRRESACSEHVR